MPTVQQLPQTTTVNPTDELMLDQSGVSVSASVAQLLAAGSAALTLTGDVTGSGTGTIVTTLAPVATPGTFSKVTVNAKGLVTGGGSVASADVVEALGYTPYNAANPAGYVAPSGLARVASSGNYGDLAGTPAFGSMAAQNASAVAITGGTIGGVDFSSVVVEAVGSTTPRSLATRAADFVNVLDYGADPSGIADSAPAFLAAMNSIPSGGWGKLVVPHGTYRLNSFLNTPSGRSVAVVFEDGAITIGSGGLGVDRVESRQGPFSLWQGGGGWFGFSPTVGAPQDYAFNTQIIGNTAGNSGATRIGWSRNYTNYNYYGKYSSGIDFAEQSIYSWPHTYDNSSGWGHWEIITGTTYDEDSVHRAHVSASAEHSEFDIVSNGPEAGWTFHSGLGLGVQGMSIDPWGQNGLYGGNILFGFGSAGSFDGQNGGLNQRWPSYPAVFSAGNPTAVAQNSTVVITFDATAHATVSVSGGGVSAVSVSNGGGIYSSVPSVVFSGGGGSGAAGTPVMLAGSIVGVTITSSGSGYSSAPGVSFTGGGVASPSPVTVTLNPDGAHGDLASIAAAINAATIPNVAAAVSIWGGVVSRLVVFGTAQNDLGTLTLGGTALGALGIPPQSYATLRDTMTVVLGGTGDVSVDDQLTINGTTVTVGGAGAQADVVSAITAANLEGIKADINANGRFVLTAWIPQNPGGLVLSQPSGFSTLGKLGLTAGTFWPPTPPKGFATAYGELSSPVCPTTDQLSIAATDLAGNTFGPVTVTLNGGGGSGWPADVALSIQAALTAAGWYGSGFNLLTAPPAIVSTLVHGSGGSQGLVIRNTAGGTLTLANVTGTPLGTLGLVPGTYQPGGFSAGSQSVFMAAEDSIAAQGRGVFVGGASTATDRTVWPHAPLEARGSFLHGLRMDKATFDDNTALLLGAGQAIGFGSGPGAVSLTNASGTFEVNGTPVALVPAVPTHTSQLTNDTGFIAVPAIPSGAGTLLGATVTAGAAATIMVGSNLSLASGTLSATGGGSGSVTSVVVGAGLAGGTITTAGTISLDTLPGASLLGNPAGTAAVPGVVAIGSGVTLSVGGTLSNAGVLSFNSRSGSVSLASSDVSAALGYTPLSNAGGTLSGTFSNSGTISGGTWAGAITAAGTLSITGAATATTQAAGDNSTNLATTAYVYQATSNASTVATTGGSVTLTAVQYGAPILLATGTLASAATFLVPNNGDWIVSNRTSGAFTLSVKTASGTGVVVDQGYSVHLIADGTDVVFATTDFNGITLQGTVTNAGTISGGAIAPLTIVAGTAGSMVTVSQSADAGGYHPVVIKAGGTNSNVPMVLTPAGAGYIATALSDGSSTNGNQRGQYSVDLQQSRSANTQVASGAYAALPGGAGNTAGGNYSLAMGQGSTATGQGSVALGQYSNDGGAYGKLVFSANGSAVGNQLAASTLYVSSVSAATRMTSDGNAAGTANSVPIRSNHVIAGTLTVAVRNVSNGDGAYWSIPVLFKNSAGTVSVSSPGTSGIAPTVADSSLTTASIAIGADNTNKGLSVTITPPTSVTVNASGVFLAAEM
jgi:hypothetical protein